ncbi:septal ring lytic transglycosylase RlpA family protein [Oceanivirga salmonicida]|uniref:septal ring lytic transglycosylase RlpA family protein n=1 Tax=Oceanivirga salmonicida TaxID=1769291 RepID=UPI0008336238|nr:septal ring lytic transglycosylase RlpA family protein [Oceanivirga salmonicida]
MKNKILILISLIFVFNVFGGISTDKIVKKATIESIKFYQKGIASFYGKRWNGRKTANGEIFNTEKLTAAHKKLPFGTWVKVTNLANGKSVNVRINDRGPFHKHRVIDLTAAAFRKIEDVEKGITKVKIEVIKIKR